MTLTLTMTALFIMAIGTPAPVRPAPDVEQAKTRKVVGTKNELIPHMIKSIVVKKSAAGKYLPHPTSPPPSPLWTVQLPNTATCPVFPAVWMPNMVAAPLEGACVYLSDVWSPPSPTKFNIWAHSNGGDSICRNNIPTGITSGTGKFAVQVYAQNLTNQSIMQTLGASVVSVKISTYYNHPALPNGVLTEVTWYDGFTSVPGYCQL